MHTLPHTHTATCRPYLIIVVILSVLTTFGEDNKFGSTTETINPALLYWKELLMISQRNDSNIGKARAFLLEENISPEANNLLLNLGDVFERISLIKKSKIECDWGDDFSHGPELLLPHLSELRSLGFCLALKSKSDILKGDGEAFIDDMLSFYTMARHIRSTPILINMLVGFALEETALNIISEHLYRLNTEELKALQKGLKSLPRGKTLTDCIPTEQQFLSGWLKNKIIEIREEFPENEDQALEEVRSRIFMLTPNDNQEEEWNDVIKSSKNSIEGMLALIEDTEDSYAKMAEFSELQARQSIKQMKEFNENLSKNSNPFTRWFLPAFHKAKEKEVEATIRREMLDLAVEVLIHNGSINDVIKNYDSSANKEFNFKVFSMNGKEVGFMLTSDFKPTRPHKRIFLTKKPIRPIILSGDPEDVGKFKVIKKD